jgi:alpha-ketoglutaric semialdehyde dehydrogenase
MEAGGLVIELTGEALIGFRRVAGRPGAFRGINPATGEQLEPAYGEAGAAEIDQACALAWAW